jgi:hypothetical protein
MLPPVRRRTWSSCSTTSHGIEAGNRSKSHYHIGTRRRPVRQTGPGGASGRTSRTARAARVADSSADRVGEPRFARKRRRSARLSPKGNGLMACIRRRLLGGLAGLLSAPRAYRWPRAPSSYRHSHRMSIARDWPVRREVGGTTRQHEQSCLFQRRDMHLREEVHELRTPRRYRASRWPRHHSDSNRQRHRSPPDLDGAKARRQYSHPYSQAARHPASASIVRRHNVQLDDMRLRRPTLRAIFATRRVTPQSEHETPPLNTSAGKRG